MDSGSIPDISTILNLRKSARNLRKLESSPILVLMNILDFVFPKTCLSCRQKGSYFCSVCLSKIKPAFQICPVCEKLSPFGQTHKFCMSKGSPDGLFYFFNYEGLIRGAIHQLKYRYVTDLAGEFWQIVLNRMESEKVKMPAFLKFVDLDHPVIVPIPLHWHKQKIRGFNQSTLFGEKLAKHYRLPFSDKILIRTKNGLSQTKLSEKEREQNVKGIFSVSPMILNSKFLIHNSNILLVDDVWTTGSTMKEATRVLKQAGVKKVWGLTIAR